MNHNTEFTFEEFIKTVNYWLIECRGNPLKEAEIIVLKGVWFGLSYVEIAKQNGYSYGYINKVASKLWKKLSEVSGEKISKTNVRFISERRWVEDARAASTANSDRDTEFTFEIILEIANDLIWQHHRRSLKNIEANILKGIWEDKTYEQIAIENRFCYDHVSSVGSRLWRQFSEASGKEINKKTWKPTFEQIWREGAARANLTQNQTQLEARLVNSVNNARSNSIDTKINENANDSFDVNRLIENVKNELGQMLSLSLDEDTSEANFQAASTAEIGRDLEFNQEKLLETARNSILQLEGRSLTEVETDVLKGVCKNYKHEHHYAPGHINNVRSELWRLFSLDFGAEVSKTTCKSALRQKCQQDTQANFTSAQIQLKDCLLNFLLNPWNTGAKFIGNVKNSLKFLVKDTANQIWQKLSKVWQEKVTPENWQAVWQPKLNPDSELTEEIVLQVISSVIFYCRGEYLHYLQEEVIYGVWQDKSYDTIAVEINCNRDYLSDMAGELWQKLSEVFASSSCKINKNNFKSTLELWFEKMKLSFLGSI